VLQKNFERYRAFGYSEITTAYRTGTLLRNFKSLAIEKEVTAR
jgi:hypothetical protein